MIKFIYFDIGDVMFGGKALKKITDELNIPHEDFIKVYLENNDEGLRGKIPTQKIWRIYKEKLNIKSDIKNYAKYFTEHLDAIPEMHQLARELSKKFSVGLLTNIYEGYVPQMLLQKKVPQLDYKSLIMSCDVGCIKPEREIFEIAQKSSGVKPSEIFFIDDQEKNVNEALRQGWNAVKFDLNNIDISIKAIQDLIKKSS